VKLDPADIAALQPVIAAAVRAVLDQIEAANAKAGSKLAYTETAAAELLSIAPHTLRDLRLRGDFKGARKAGKRVVYPRSALLRFLSQG
jgi:hypothetical protein